MSDFGQVALATSRGDSDCFGILNPRLCLWASSHDDRNVEAIPRVVHRNILLLDVGRRTGRVRIQQVPELGMVEDEPAVVADGRVALRARAEALLPRGHPFFMFAGAPRQRSIRRRVLLCLNSPSLEHAVPTPRWDVQRAPN